MKLFSQRKGLKPIKTIVQINSMDDELRNGLWNILTILYWDQVKGAMISSCNNIEALLMKLWLNYFKKPIDTLDKIWEITRNEIREYFFNCKWYEVYDFIEFVANNYPDEYSRVNPKFMAFCNFILERELSAYRFVGGKITQITSEEEISEIEEALESSKPFNVVNIHLKSALNLLANRKSPDYRNSIKESISAVNAICNIITGEKTTGLGQALKKIKEKKSIDLHPALEKAFNSLYGYTSDAEGIRHALLNEPKLGFEDAKFMMVSCSAFINYLISKTSK